MKKLIFLVLLFSTSAFSQTAVFSLPSGSQLDNFKSNLKDLKDETGNYLFNDNLPDSLLILYGDTVRNHFGRSVSTAGDVNGDGYSDVIVGAYTYDSNTGRAYIFYGGLSMNNVADVTLLGESTSSNFGHTVSSAGDVNGDGFSDVIVGAYLYNSTGRAYIFYGGISMNNIADVTLSGISLSSYFGYSVSTAGDVNSDGYSDVIVGAYGDVSGVGRAYIFYGGFSMNNVADVTLTGESANNGFGYSVSTSRDVNGDGYSDVIVGAYTYNSSTGRAYIFFGGLSMNNVSDVIMTGELTNNNFGGSVSTAGDVNGDGYSDVIVGAYSYNSNTGRAYIFYGGLSMNNVSDVIMTGESTNTRFGRSVSTTGDVNGDGFTDVIVGANNYNSTTGRAYVFYGGLSMNNISDMIMTGESINNSFGFSVSTAGDVNGDGFSDVIVGAFSFNSDNGRAYIYYSITLKPKLINPLNNSEFNPLTINFKWEKLNTAVFYILIISTDSDFNNIIVFDTVFVDTSKILSDFQKDTDYFWRVIAKDSSGITNISPVWNFKTIPPIKINVKVLIEGMFYPVFNQMTRADSISVYLRNSTFPYSVADSSKNKIDSTSFSNVFIFPNALQGSYYIELKHFNCIETWSKVGGESFNNDGSVYYYDFTSSISQAYGSNMRHKGTKYCIFSGDVNQDGIVDASDLSWVENDVFDGLTGLRLSTDLNGDNFVDAEDLSIVDNNKDKGIIVITP